MPSLTQLADDFLFKTSFSARLICAWMLLSRRIARHRGFPGLPWPSPPPKGSNHEDDRQHDPHYRRHQRHRPALAEAFHDRGNRVIVTGRRQSLLDQIAAERPDRSPSRLTLPTPRACRTSRPKSARSFPELNVLIANAGVSRSEDMTTDGWDAADAEAIVATNILGGAARHRSGPAAPETAAERDDHGDQLEPRLCAPCRLPGLLCQQGVPAFLASVAAASASQDPHRGAGARTALCANRAHRHATGERYARDAARRLYRGGHAIAGVWRLIPATKCWSSATAPAAGPSATAAMRPPLQP